MSACDGCSRRSERCHADCAEYLAERVLHAENKIREERDYQNYQADAVYKGGRRKSGRKAYKGWRKPGWKIRGGGSQ